MKAWAGHSGAPHSRHLQSSTHSKNDNSIFLRSSQNSQSSQSRGTSNEWYLKDAEMRKPKLWRFMWLSMLSHPVYPQEHLKRCLFQGSWSKLFPRQTCRVRSGYCNQLTTVQPGNLNTQIWSHLLEPTSSVRGSLHSEPKLKVTVLDEPRWEVKGTEKRSGDEEHDQYKIPPGQPIQQGDHSTEKNNIQRVQINTKNEVDPRSVIVHQIMYTRKQEENYLIFDWSHEGRSPVLWEVYLHAEISRSHDKEKMTMMGYPREEKSKSQISQQAIINSSSRKRQQKMTHDRMPSHDFHRKSVFYVTEILRIRFQLCLIWSHQELRETDFHLAKHLHGMLHIPSTLWMRGAWGKLKGESHCEKPSGKDWLLSLKPPHAARGEPSVISEWKRVGRHSDQVLNHMTPVSRTERTAADEGLKQPTSMEIKIHLLSDHLWQKECKAFLWLCDVRKIRSGLWRLPYKASCWGFYINTWGKRQMFSIGLLRSIS